MGEDHLIKIVATQSFVGFADADEFELLAGATNDCGLERGTSEVIDSRTFARRDWCSVAEGDHCRLGFSQQHDVVGGDAGEPSGFAERVDLEARVVGRVGENH